jgi:hypothetical protein
MSITDYLIDSALVLLVLLQIKWRPLTNRTLIRPLVIVAIAVVSYFNSIPTAGNDLVLIVVLAAFGGLIGISAGQATFVRRNADGVVEARAGWLAGVLWVLGMGLRFGFLVWINTSSGSASLVHFSASHSITGAAAWTDALLAMAVLEVVGRSALLFLRRDRMRRVSPAAELA